MTGLISSGLGICEPRGFFFFPVAPSSSTAPETGHNWRWTVGRKSTPAMVRRHQDLSLQWLVSAALLMCSDVQLRRNFPQAREAGTVGLIDAHFL